MPPTYPMPPFYPRPGALPCCPGPSSRPEPFQPNPLGDPHLAERLKRVLDTLTADMAWVRANKVDKASGGVPGNIAGIDANGNLYDTGKRAAGVYDKPDGGIPYADLSEEVRGWLDAASAAVQASGAKTDGNFTSWDANGKLVDSGKKPADFATAAQGAKADTAVQPSAISGFVDGAEYDAEYGDPAKPTILLKHGDAVVASVDATDFVIDGMVSDVKIENGYLVITFNTDSGKQPINIPLTDIFNPANYYDKTAADARFVQKETGKGLSANDYTDADKAKVDGALQKSGGTMTGELSVCYELGQSGNSAVTLADNKVTIGSAAINAEYQAYRITRKYLGNSFNLLLPFASGTIALTADATLAERTGQGDDWQFGPLTTTDTDYSWAYTTPEYSNGVWTTEITNGPDFATLTANGGADATYLEFATASGATPTASGVVWRSANGYQLGSQSGKSLASEAEAEALRQAVAAKQDALTFDNAPTSGSNNPVKSGGIWSAIWGVLSVLPTGFTSLYDWCVDQLNRKANRAANPTTGNLAALDANGNPTDSGKKSADFMPANAKIQRIYNEAGTDALDDKGGLYKGAMVESSFKNEALGRVYPYNKKDGDTYWYSDANGSAMYNANTGDLRWGNAVYGTLLARCTAGLDPREEGVDLNPQKVSGQATWSFTPKGVQMETSTYSHLALESLPGREYSNTATYAVGDLVKYRSSSSDPYKAYRCSTAITAAENWNSAHWVEIPVLSQKANRAANPTAGDLAALDSEGNPTDSGKKPADFATAVQGAKAEDSVQRVLDNANPSAKTAVTVGVRSTEDAADRGQASLAVGDHPKASGKNAVATGTWTQATGQDAHAEGNLSQATNYGAHAEGDNTRATGAYSHGEGTDTEASGLVSHAEGNYTTAAGTGAHTEGMFSKASGVAAHAEGSNLDKLAALLQAAGADQQIVALFTNAATDAAGSFSHTEGLVSATSQMGSHAQGFRASDDGKQFSFVWQGYGGDVPTPAQMQALLDDPTSQDAQAALQCLVTALNARAAYTSKGSGTFCVNPVPQGGSTDPKSGFYIGEESLSKALRYSFNAATVTPGSSGWTSNYSQIYNKSGELVDVEMPSWDTESTPDGDKTGWFWYSPDMVYNLLSEDESATPLIAYWEGYDGEEYIDYDINFSKTTSPATVTNVKDRAINSATLGSSVTAATVTLPAATTGRSRDFYIDLTIEATDAPTLTFHDPATQTTAAIKFGADSLADIAPGYNLVLWTELPNNRWLVSVKHEDAS